MFPWIRFTAAMVRARRMPPLAPGDVHRETLRVMPWDIDYQFELNNGRIITLFDIVRIPMLIRMNVLKATSERGWYGTVLGSSLRYRRRITLFQKIELRCRTLGVDERFIYIEQGIFRGGECCAHALIRIGITPGKGIVPPREVLEALGMDTSWPLPDWVHAWTEADKERPWPPMQDDVLHAALKPD